MPKIVNTALKAKAKAKAWTFEAKAKAKAKATGPEAKAKAIKFGLEAPRGQGLASRTTSLSRSYSYFALQSVYELGKVSTRSLKFRQVLKQLDSWV